MRVLRRVESFRWDRSRMSARFQQRAPLGEVAIRRRASEALGSARSRRRLGTFRQFESRRDRSLS